MLPLELQVINKTKKKLNVMMKSLSQTIDDAALSWGSLQPWDNRTFELSLNGRPTIYY